MREVRDYLTQRAPAVVAKQIRVVAPSYVPIAVHAQVALGDASLAATVEEDLRQRIDAFLHPLKGGPRGNGWAFGEAVHLSQIATVIRNTPGVDYASQVQLSSDDAICGDTIAIRDGLSRDTCLLGAESRVENVAIELASLTAVRPCHSLQRLDGEQGALV